MIKNQLHINFAGFEERIFPVESARYNLYPFTHGRMELLIRIECLRHLDGPNTNRESDIYLPDAAVEPWLELGFIVNDVRLTVGQTFIQNDSIDGITSENIGLVSYDGMDNPERYSLEVECLTNEGLIARISGEGIRYTGNGRFCGSIELKWDSTLTRSIW